MEFFALVFLLIVICAALIVLIEQLRKEYIPIPLALTTAVLATLCYLVSSPRKMPASVSICGTSFPNPNHTIVSPVSGTVVDSIFANGMHQIRIRPRVFDQKSIRMPIANGHYISRKAEYPVVSYDVANSEISGIKIDTTQSSPIKGKSKELKHGARMGTITFGKDVVVVITPMKQPPPNTTLKICPCLIRGTRVISGHTILGGYIPEK